MNWQKATKNADGSYKIPQNWISLHYYEVLSIPFRFENALRVFVYAVLKDELQKDWDQAQVADEDGKSDTILNIFKRRLSQSKSFGYLGHQITCPVMHLTSGELIQLLTSEAYWKHFRNHFLANKEIIKTKLQEIGTIRNTVAHFRPVKSDDVEVALLNTKQVLKGVELFIGQIRSQSDVVPTNTTEDWYRELHTVGTDICSLNFHQSGDANWIKLTISYKCPILSKLQYESFVSYSVLNIKSTSILMKSPILKDQIIFMSENIPFTPMPVSEDPSFIKQVNLVINRSKIMSDHTRIKQELETVVRSIIEETDLIKQDNLARGDYVVSTRVYATRFTNNETKVQSWKINTEELQTKLTENEPPEFWGTFWTFPGDDFVGSTSQYPWMPEPISV